MNLLIGSHTRQRMAERLITRHDIIKTIEANNKVITREGRYVYTQGIIRVVTTIHKVEDEIIYVVTVTYTANFNNKIRRLANKHKITDRDAIKILRGL